jgi:hypothetical protein
MSAMPVETDDVTQSGTTDMHDQLGQRCVKAMDELLVGGRPESASLWMLPYVMFPWISNLISSLAEVCV